MQLAEAVTLIPQQLSRLTYLTVVGCREALQREHSSYDLEIVAEHLTFLVEYKSVSSAEAVGSALFKLESGDQRTHTDLTPTLLVVPFMTNVGRRLCEDAGVNWMDLSGNASIRAPGINVNVSGKPNRYRKSGRPSDLFALKATRIARALIMSPERSWLSHELVDATGLSKGYVSKVLSRLQTAGFVERSEGRRYTPRNTGALLEAWRESRDFGKQRMLKGHVADRTPEAILRRLVSELSGFSVRTAITGLAAAWHYNEYADYRLCTLYAAPLPGPDQLRDVGFRPVKSGANVWLVEPSDASVFDGVISADHLPYVSPLQAYLDLKDHPERAEEAAEVLRPRVLEGALRA